MDNAQESAWVERDIFGNIITGEPPKELPKPPSVGIKKEVAEMMLAEPSDGVNFIYLPLYLIRSMSRKESGVLRGVKMFAMRAAYEARLDARKKANPNSSAYRFSLEYWTDCLNRFYPFSGEKFPIGFDRERGEECGRLLDEEVKKLASDITGRTELYAGPVMRFYSDAVVKFKGDAYGINGGAFSVFVGVSCMLTHGDAIHVLSVKDIAIYSAGYERRGDVPAKVQLLTEDQIWTMLNWLFMARQIWVIQLDNERAICALPHRIEREEFYAKAKEYREAVKAYQQPPESAPSVRSERAEYLARVGRT